MKTPNSPLTPNQSFRRPSPNRFILLIGLLAAVGLLLGSCSVSDSFSLNGKIDGLQEGDSVFLLVMPNPMEITGDEVPEARYEDTLVTTVAGGGQFSFTGQVEAVKDARLVFRNLGPRAPSLSLFLEPGAIAVTGQLDPAFEVTATGTPNNDLMTAHGEKEQQLYAGLRPIQDSLRDTTLGEQERAALNREASHIREQVRENRLDFIRGNPGSYAVPTYLRLLEDNLDLDTLEQLYSALEPEVKRSRFARGTAAKIEARRRTAIGQPAPDFSAINHRGDSVHLSDYRGNYVLIDFWASWCVPCRAEHPHLRDAYARFKDRGFDILGVSLDDNRDRWLEAIAADQLTWANVSELKGFGDPIARLYGVQPIPDNFLVDPDGIIVARRLRGDRLSGTLAQFLGE